ncbi:MAG: ATP-binding protein [Verrucomicrobiota bacterium]
MSKPQPFNDPAIFEAFLAYERQERITHTKVGCLLVLTLMPLGIPMDYYVYPGKFWLFLKLRVWSAVIAGFIWLLMETRFGRRSSKWLGRIIPMVPVFFIAWMILVSEGFLSPYYAGLNLVLLAVGTLLQWTFLESLAAVCIVFVLYIVIGILHGGSVAVGILANNFFFIICMDVIAVVGTYFQYRGRFREFALRYQLDRNQKELEESNRKLMELDQIKSRFFANISHELRTPLTLLLAPLEKLLHHFNRNLDAEAKELLTTMHANGMRLLKLINDLLDLVRMESGRMEVKSERIQVREFIKGLASAARQVADDKRLKLDTHVDPALDAVMGDRDKLEKIVLNLVFNALKFTPAGGSVTLRAELRGQDFVLAVSDTGMGISEKNLPYVFDRFWQADDSSRRKYQGVGIGLALVKELTEIQGGTVDVQSSEGKGTTFTVRFPYHKADPLPAAPAAEPADEAAADDESGRTVTSEQWLANLYRRAELFPAMTALQDSIKPVELARNGHLPKALVADDEPDMLRFLKLELSRNYEVLEAVDGQQAIEKAAQFLPDIIVLDMMMPEKDGLQACRELRERTSTQAIPIVLLTARADEETKMAALKAGASDFLAKPFSTAELHVRIRNLVESHQFQHALARQNRTLESTLDELKDTQTQLVQSEKLASLGRMSAGIIHEINNPLNFATTGLFTLRQKAKFLPAEQQPEYNEILADVEDGVKRVKTIVSDLRMFSHPDTERRDDVDVREVVASALRFLSNEWKDRVRIEQDLAERQTLVANKNKLIHVVVNLLQNSIDALKTKDFHGEQPTVRIEGRVEGGKSILRFRDNGPGIADKHLDKIFDPFYTTKDVGEGTGLGLSICYRIVQEYDGRISVKTEPGIFCEFTLEFPVKG